MNRSLQFVRSVALAAGAAWFSPVAPAESADLVLVDGGPFQNTRAVNFTPAVELPSFRIGRYEVTQREWVEVMGENPSHFRGDDLPVDSVSWYDCIEYCNRRSLKEGLEPCYEIDRRKPDPNNHNAEDDVKWTVTLRLQANGYRLPTEAEWEYAASGGRASRGFNYSGGDDLAAVGWFWMNSGDEPLGGLWNWPAIEKNRGRSRRVGAKPANELGLHDLSGNVREWCWDWFGELGASPALTGGSPAGTLRVWKGGGWLGGDFCCVPSFRAGFEPHGRGSDQGFRVCRRP